MSTFPVLCPYSSLFIRLMKALSTVSVLLILVLICLLSWPLPSSTWFKSRELYSLDLLSQNLLPCHDVSFQSMDTELRLWLEISLIQTSSIRVPFFAGLTHCVSVCVSFLALFVFKLPHLLLSGHSVTDWALFAHIFSHRKLVLHP